MIGILLRQFLKHQVNRILKFLIIFPDLHRVNELNEGGEILFLCRGLIVDVANEGAAEQRLGLW